MKRTGLLKIMAMLIVACLCFAGCSDNSDSESANSGNATQEGTTQEETSNEGVSNTVAGKLVSAFKEEIAKNTNIEEIANVLAQNEILAEQNMVTMPVEAGYLDGFDVEVTGFNSGIKFSPMIGSIPFVAYIFETDNAGRLGRLLEEHSMLNWNICTAADEMQCVIMDNYVFFVMAPNSFE